MPVLDDRNINDQGLDADGATTTFESTIEVTGPDASGTAGANPKPLYFVGNHVDTDATAIIAAKAAFIEWVEREFPAIYAAMAHTTTAADYALQIAASTVKQIVTLDVETVAEHDVYTLTYDGVTLTSTALDATPTDDELLAALIGGDNATAYAALPFVLTAVNDHLVATWKLAGAVSKPIVLARTVGTAIAEDPVISTLGAWTIYDLGYRVVLKDSVNGAGNLYGSSKDIGYITGKIPALGESGGRVNRVGFARIDLEGTLSKFGFFFDYTEESLNFDTDEELLEHLTTESIKAAHEINEDQLQIDLLNAAGVIRFTGSATQVSELQGDSADPDKVEYADLVKLSMEADNNRTPKKTKIITGSRMVDTKVVPAARYLYCGSELLPSIMKMVDYHNERAFIPVAQYGAAGTIARGEIGTIYDFRIIQVPEMMKWAGVGAEEGTNGGYYTTGGKYDVFPMLMVGDASFTTIGFQTDGKTVKFKTKHVKPSENHSTTDPFGETGFYSTKWYYGFMALRPERIGLIKTVAEI